MKMFHSDQRGVAHLGLIILAVVVLAGVGFAVWKVTSKDNDSSAVNNEVQKAAQDECEKENDKDLCKFLTSWKASEKYRITSESNGNKSVFEIDGDKSHITTSGQATYEVITIDKTTYTKAGETWYKQTAPEQQQSPADYKPEFKEPASDDKKAEDTTTYQSQGKEACGDLQCFKYQVVDAGDSDKKEFIWFDDQDYKLRKTVTETPDGTSEQTFEYDNVTIEEPSPVKELGPDEYIVPGTDKPTKLPSMPAGAPR